MALFSILSIIYILFILCLTYYELGDKAVSVVIPTIITSNTTLVITLYEAYNPSLSWQYNATINTGSGCKNIKTIIWATSKFTPYFSSDFLNELIFYSGYIKGAINKVSQNEFGKDADVIYSSYRSPLNVNIFYDGKS